MLAERRRDINIFAMAMKFGVKWRPAQGAQGLPDLHLRREGHDRLILDEKKRRDERRTPSTAQSKFVCVLLWYLIYKRDAKSGIFFILP